ncbi:hypothetical protein LSAT2_023287 [Lamellibrachia satsuma]|nr:hypothetical protein LSAT2_023287 [Lamellibrachia satsuma]
MGLDEALEALGKYGRYQLLTYCLVGLVSAAAGTWQLFVIVFIGYINPHHCKVPEDVPVERYIPKDVSTGVLLACRMYGNVSAGGNDTVACTNGYTYDPAGFDPNGGTITMQVRPGPHVSGPGPAHTRGPKTDKPAARKPAVR